MAFGSHLPVRPRGKRHFSFKLQVSFGTHLAERSRLKRSGLLRNRSASGGSIWVHAVSADFVPASIASTFQEGNFAGPISSRFSSWMTTRGSLLYRDFSGSMAALWLGLAPVCHSVATRLERVGRWVMPSAEDDVQAGLVCLGLRCDRRKGVCRCFASQYVY